MTPRYVIVLTEESIQCMFVVKTKGVLISEKNVRNSLDSEHIAS